MQSIPQTSYPLSPSSLCPSSKAKILGFAVFIILSLGSLIVMGIGLGRYMTPLRVLNHPNPLNSHIMIGAGSAGGILFLVGAIGLLNSLQKEPFIPEKSSVPDLPKIPEPSAPANIDEKSSVSDLPKITETSATANTNDLPIYDPKRWKALWNVEILNYTPPPPIINWEQPDPFFVGKKLKETSLLVFIPPLVSFKDRVAPPTLNSLEQILKHCSLEGQKFHEYLPLTKSHLGEKTINSGWILITKTILPGSEKNNLGQQFTLLADRMNNGYQIPTVGELVISALLHQAQTGEYIYGRNLGMYSRCQESPYIVGGFDSEGISIFPDNGFRFGNVGFGACKRF